MKIVDEKGKFLGKLNIIDLLAIIILIAAVIFAAVRFLAPKEDVINGATKLTYTAMVGTVEPDVYDEVLRQFAASGGRDQLMANGEMVNAFITKIDAVPHVNYETAADGTVTRSVEDFDGGRLDVTFTVEAYVADPVTSKVGTQEVRVGKSHILKTTHIEFPYSLITSCQWG